MVKGTTLGAVTDIEGKFTILNVPGTAKTVIVSFVCMHKVEAAIKPAMKVVLKSDSELLDEVMVVAYGHLFLSSYLPTPQRCSSWAADSSVESPKRSPISCMPTGRPLLSLPHGMEDVYKRQPQT